MNARQAIEWQRRALRIRRHREMLKARWEELDRIMREDMRIEGWNRRLDAAEKAEAEPR